MQKIYTYTLFCGNIGMSYARTILFERFIMENKIYLWENPPYIADTNNEFRPFIVPYEVNDTKTAVIVIPGGGYGGKAGHEGEPIAKMFNDEGIKSAGYYQKKLYGKRLGYNKPEIGHKYLWDNTGVKRILQNEFYAGTLVCHKTYTSKITHIRKDIPEEEQYRHENAVPAIVSREIWE